ncbi:MAG: ATP-binding protein, partial [Pseudomonadales bacterium]
ADVDADDGTMRHLKTLVGSDTNIESHYNLLAMRSPEANKILASLDRANSQIVIYDKQLQVRASVGKLTADVTESNQINGTLEQMQYWLNRGLDWFVAIPAYLSSSQEASQEQELLNKALNKEFATGRWHRNPGEEVLGVAAPITDQEGALLGVVMIKQSTAQILKLQQQAMQNITLLSFITMVAILFVLLTFSWRQAYRVQRLGREAQEIVDPSGRLRTNQLRSDVRSSDRIGALARSFSDVVERLHEHQQFIATMPRTLRHEINNPLNATMTSLENLQRHGIADDQQRYLDIAQRGLVKIGAIVEKLADAANLEEALQEDDLEPLNLAYLLETYVNHQERSAETGQEDVVFSCNESQIAVAGVDYRIEQLLDKLLDNARDFRTPESTIVVRLYRQDLYCYLEVENQGPHIPDSMQGKLFSSMVSARQGGTGKAHFGLGLYIVRMIALYHEGEVSAHNLVNPQSVMFRVRLPVLLV